jgi:hypothetical protein
MDLTKTLDLHGKWRRGEPGGERADFTGADFTGADLRIANLTGANLGDADLKRADLRGADLTGANLTGANLSGTCLDHEAPIPPIDDDVLLDAGLEIVGDRVYGWRTARSQHVGSTVYSPGSEHVAPWFSVAETECHPGIYLAGEVWLDRNAVDLPRVRCWTLRNDLHRAGDKFRCRKLNVVGP